MAIPHEVAHGDTAARFMAMVHTLDALRPIYRRPVGTHPPTVNGEDYLDTHLRWFIQQNTAPAQFLTRSNVQHSVMVLTKSAKDGRRTYPKPIYDALELLPAQSRPWSGTSGKVEVKWIVCYMARLFPDQNSPNWQQFECSHRCIGYGLATPQGNYMCIDPACMCWESKAKNQSRGGADPFCFHVCTHCQQPLCVCQNFHNPCCL
jgi:hypothetical protein